MSAASGIVLYLAFLISLFFIDSFAPFLLIFAVLSILLFRLPFRTIRRGWLPVGLLLLFTFASNAVEQEGRILFSLGSFLITDEGLRTASLRTIRVFFMIAGARVLTSSMNTESLVEGLERILIPLKRLGVPVPEFLATMKLAIRSLPKIRERIGVAYREQTQGERTKGFWRRARGISLFLAPLFVESIRRPESFFDDETKGN